MFRKLANLFRKSRTGDLNEFKDLFQRFQQVLKGNNRILALMSELDDKTSGEYIFDINYLDHVVRELSATVQLVISNLNVIGRNRYRDLFDCQSAIEKRLINILEGRPVADDPRLVIDYSDWDSEIVELTGGKNARLSEIKNNLRIRTPEGFAITTVAFKKFMEHNNLWPQVRSLYDNYMQGTRGREKELSRAIDDLFGQSRCPAELTTAVNRQLAVLRERLPDGATLVVRSSAYGEDACGRSFAGQFASFLNCRDEHVLSLCSRVLASRVKPGVLVYGGDEALDEDALPMALGVQHMVRARTAGVVYSVEPSGESPDCLAISATFGLGAGVVGGTVDSDYFRVSRLDPTRVVSSRIGKKTTKMVPAAGLGIASELVDDRLREKPCLSDSQLVELSEAALMLDRYFKRPVDIEWCIDESGQLYILQCRPLKVTSPRQSDPGERAAALADAPVIMRGAGEVAQRGIAAGIVRQVQEDDDPESFPTGAIAVTRYTTPRLASLIRKAAAIITDVGSPTGHLATVAREFGVPMIVNAGEATSRLRDGSEITVDAEENVIYGGVIQNLLEYDAEAEDVYRDLKEYRILRQLIRSISPLNLIDPDGPEFAAKNCRTYHDIARFAHEKAVKTLIDLNVSSRRFRGVESRELKLEIPLGLHVVDMGGGLVIEPEEKTIDSIDKVLCRPMKSLLSGLVAPGAWSTQPIQLGFGDLVSSLTRFSMTDRAGDFRGLNLAVISTNYANLSLRLGYHFNVVDTYVSESVDDNYIYFRFVGGVTENERRRLRAILIKEILLRMDFNVTVNEDLVVARLKKQSQEELLQVLNDIGRLIGFTRQLDTQMVSQESIDQGLRAFFSSTSEQQ